jgi:SAM-dependent methyltransferase
LHVKDARVEYRHKEVIPLMTHDPSSASADSTAETHAAAADAPHTAAHAAEADHAHHSHDTPAPTEEFPFGLQYWEDRYAAPGLAWSGNPNPVLVTEATPLAPGRALDIGSGEGADAFWLAARGWSVTGVDISTNALDKARAAAEAHDPAAAARIQWEQHDLTSWLPSARSYDLVSSQFMHLPEPSRSTLFRGLAAAVAPGGTLLIVAHDVSGLDEADHHAHLTELMFGVDDVLAAIDGESLTVEVAESREREAAPAAGESRMRDIVVRATRTAAVAPGSTT